MQQEGIPHGAKPKFQTNQGISRPNFFKNTKLLICIKPPGNKTIRTPQCRHVHTGSFPENSSSSSSPRRLPTTLLGQPPRLALEDMRHTQLPNSCGHRDPFTMGTQPKSFRWTRPEEPTRGGSSTPDTGQGFAKVNLLDPVPRRSFHRRV